MSERPSAAASPSKPAERLAGARQISINATQDGNDLCLMVIEGDLFDFDAHAWRELVEEQRLRIARAAGVDPSKVTIRVGH